MLRRGAKIAAEPSIVPKSAIRLSWPARWPVGSRPSPLKPRVTLAPMFSYRHGFHAGNHADVLKHTTLIALLRHLCQKETPISVLDTHAGAGLYRLDSRHALTSYESSQGIGRLIATPTTEALAPALRDYLDTVASFNRAGDWRIYPGSPFIIHRLLRAQDRLVLFELHPTDAQALLTNVGQLRSGRQIETRIEDGFEGVRALLPPPSRRGLVLCDPSYEIKSDYARVATMLGDALKRFATGVYAVWYPLIPRPEAHALPRKLKTLAGHHGRPWLNASLTVKSGRTGTTRDNAQHGGGLPASGMFIINPPHTLKGTMQEALVQISGLLAQDRHASFILDSAN